MGPCPALCATLLPHHDPEIGMGCGRAADAGPSSASSAGQGTPVLLAAGHPEEEARAPGCTGHPSSFPPPFVGGYWHNLHKRLFGMRKSTASGWALPNLHGSQRPLWKWLHRNCHPESFLFPFHSHFIRIGQVYTLKLPSCRKGHAQISSLQCFPGLGLGKNLPNLLGLWASPCTPADLAATKSELGVDGGFTYLL